MRASCIAPIIAAACAGVLSSCGSANDARTGRVPEAEARLADFLKGAEESQVKYAYAPYVACQPQGMSDKYLAIGTFRILGSRVAGDSALVSALVTSVAEETKDPQVYDGYLATQRVRADSLHWMMTKDSLGQWGVCGYSREGFGVGMYGSDSTIRWTPKGASFASIRSLAESISNAR